MRNQISLACLIITLYRVHQHNYIHLPFSAYTKRITENKTEFLFSPTYHRLEFAVRDRHCACYMIAGMNYQRLCSKARTQTLLPAVGKAPDKGGPGYAPLRCRRCSAELGLLLLSPSQKNRRKGTAPLAGRISTLSLSLNAEFQTVGFPSEQMSCGNRKAEQTWFTAVSGNHIASHHTLVQQLFESPLKARCT